jgi:hypothetical protein
MSADRFWSKVQKSDDGCWEWLAAVSNHGYGVFCVRRGLATSAHRVAYELMVGAIPDGHVLDHMCNNTRCVRPDHLRPVRQRENVLRAASIPAANAAKTHCPKGHPYTGFRKSRYGVSRICRVCINALQRARRAAA